METDLGGRDSMGGSEMVYLYHTGGPEMGRYL